MWPGRTLGPGPGLPGSGRGLVAYRGGVSGEQHEPNRVLGFPVGPRPPRQPRPQRPGRESGQRTPVPEAPRQGEEPQRVLGFPVDLFSRVSLDRLRDLVRTVAARRR
jgi:hypothetical protein